MIFKDLKVGTNTPINKNLFYDMARNDDILKLYYESCRTGVLGWREIDSSIYIPTKLTPEQIEAGDLGEGEDPTWATIASIPVVIEDKRVVRLSMSAFMNTHQSTSGIPTQYRANLRARFHFDYPSIENEGEDEEILTNAVSLIPYDYVSNGEFLSAERSKEYGRIFAQNIVISTTDYLLAKSNTIRIKKYQKYNLIKPGKAYVAIKILKRDVPQSIFASDENKIQIIIEDGGAWR